MKVLFLSLLFVFNIFIACHSYKILIYQTLPASSHIQFSGKIADVLIDAGHTVDKFIVEWNPHVTSNGTNRARRIRRFRLSTESPWMSMPHLAKPFDEKVYGWGDDEPVYYRKTLESFCDEMLTDKTVLEWIKEGEYDAAMSSAYDACGFGLFHLAGIRPVFVYSSTPIIDHWMMILGIPNMASFVPNALRNNGEGDIMDAVQKLSVLSDRTHQQQVVLPSYHQVQTDVFRKHFGPDFPPVSLLASRISTIFVNTHPLLELQRPYSHKVKQIGGLTTRECMKLEPKFEKILNMSSKGTVLFSFGSLARIRDIPDHILEMFIAAFDNFKEHNFIWKFEEERPELFQNSTNIFTMKWVQQVELLNDHRVKLFISHTGMNSLSEAAHSGTPVLSVPLFLDQHYNALVLERRGVSIIVKKHDLSVQSITKSIRKLLYSDTYQNNAQILQKMIKNFPDKPDKTLVSWVEYGTENKDLDKHFHMVSSGMSLYEYFCIDVLVLVAMWVAVGLAGMYLSLRVVKMLIVGHKVK